MLEERIFKRVSSDWINLMTKLEQDGVIDHWMIDKVYKNCRLIDISVHIPIDMVELFDNIVFR
jgi:hypothetical protein